MHDEEEFQRQKELERQPVEPRIEDLQNAYSHEFEKEVLEENREEEWRRIMQEMDKEQMLAALAEEERRQQEVFDSVPSIFIAARHTDSALQTVSSSDYSSECQNCGAKPFSEGPHHSSSCSRHEDRLALSTKLAHRYSCTHCGAQPFVAGAHHKRDCPRRIKKHIERSVTGDYDYSTTCTHCGVKPFTQGPHHDSDCKRNWSYSAYATKLAHKYECSNCGAKPFVAGPHHRGSCDRHFY